MAFEDPNYLRNDQYKTADNLTARVDLHKAFSTNKYSWFRWVFDQLDLPSNARILEIGCGRGDLWQENISKVPANWDITLSDFSEGMLAETKTNLAAAAHSFKFKQIDIRAIPFDDDQFDAVIANHMLYHVPDRDNALHEVSRVIGPGGKFYATTVSAGHMSELTQLVGEFTGEEISFDFDCRRLDFVLENGSVQLEPFFESIEMRQYDDALVVTEIEPLENYVWSGRFKQALKGRRNKFHEFLKARMKEQGAIHISKDSGIFICRKK